MSAQLSLRRRVFAPTAGRSASSVRQEKRSFPARAESEKIARFARAEWLLLANGVQTNVISIIPSMAVERKPRNSFVSAEREIERQTRTLSSRQTAERQKKGTRIEISFAAFIVCVHGVPACRRFFIPAPLADRSEAPLSRAHTRAPNFFRHFPVKPIKPIRCD